MDTWKKEGERDRESERQMVIVRIHFNIIQLARNLYIYRVSTNTITPTQLLLTTTLFGF